MTREQRDFAAFNHSLVFKFLNKKHLGEDEYYDIVIFGYLRAVQKYIQRPELHRYKFSTIAWSAMETDVRNYHEYKNRPMRKAVCCSLDQVIPNTDDLLLGSVIPTPYNTAESLEDSLLWMEVASAITKKQMDILQLKVAGMSEREIAREYQTSCDSIETVFEAIKERLRDLFGPNKL
jgi:RNA polymerase sigma factor (sigma-70 family)